MYKEKSFKDYFLMYLLFKEDLMDQHVVLLMIFAVLVCISLSMIVYCSIKQLILKLKKKPADEHIPALDKVFGTMFAFSWSVFLIIAAPFIWNGL